jgi:putative membrane protein
MRSENRALLIILGVLILLVLLMPMLGIGMMGPGMMGGFGWPGGQSGGWSWTWGLAMGLGMLAMLAFWGAIIVGIALLVRSAVGAGGRQDSRTEESALEILKRRYAAGEITREEYVQMRLELEEQVS